MNAFKVDNKIQVENEMKEHPLFVQRQRTITIKSKKYIELLSMHELTFTTLDKTINEIILITECNPENFKKILDENKRLKKDIACDNQKYNKCVSIPCVSSDYDSDSDYESEYESTTVAKKEIENYGIVINEIRLKRRDKGDDGLFHIDGRIYKLLEGTRADVWEGNAYQTAGGLIKKDLLVNKDGKIVSKSKSIEGITNIRFGLRPNDAN